MWLKKGSFGWLLVWLKGAVLNNCKSGQKGQFWVVISVVKKAVLGDYLCG